MRADEPHRRSRASVLETTQGHTAGEGQCPCLLLACGAGGDALRLSREPLTLSCLLRPLLWAPFNSVQDGGFFVFVFFENIGQFKHMSKPKAF